MEREELRGPELAEEGERLQTGVTLWCEPCGGGGRADPGRGSQQRAAEPFGQTAVLSLVAFRFSTATSVPQRLPITASPRSVLRALCTTCDLFS